VEKKRGGEIGGEKRIMKALSERKAGHHVPFTRRSVLTKIDSEKDRHSSWRASQFILRLTTGRDRGQTWDNELGTWVVNSWCELGEST